MGNIIVIHHISTIHKNDCFVSSNNNNIITYHKRENIINYYIH